MDGLHYTITVEPRGSTYEKLLRLASRWCTLGLLVVRDRLRLDDKAHEILAQLEPFLVRKESATGWPGTVLLSGSASVWTFHLEPSVLSVLLDAAEGLYDWQQPQLPEDLGLLRAEDHPWLASIATRETRSSLSGKMNSKFFATRLRGSSTASNVTRNPILSRSRHSKELAS